MKKDFDGNLNSVKFPVDSDRISGIVALLKDCTKQKDLETGYRIHGAIVVEHCWQLCQATCIANTFINLYAKCDALTDARNVFDQLPLRNVVSWNALLTGYAQLGESGKVFHLFHRIIGEGMKPSATTFLIVLNACSRVGLFYNNHTYFDIMTEEYGISPTIKHITGMIYLLCRIGDMHNAIRMAKQMPSSTNLVAWHSILGVCRDHGNVALARDAFTSVMKVNQNDASSYILMAQISTHL